MSSLLDSVLIDKVELCLLLRSLTPVLALFLRSSIMAIESRRPPSSASSNSSVFLSPDLSAKNPSLPANYPLSTSSTSSTSSNTTTPLYSRTTSTSNTSNLIYDLVPTPYPSSDPSTQDFDFEDLFTYTNYPPTKMLPSYPPSLHPKSSKGGPSPDINSQPQPDRRNWSKFSFSHYNLPPPRPKTSYTTLPVASTRPRRQEKGIKARRS